MSVFVYRPRALINDQVSKTKHLEPLGISVEVLNGETDLPAEKTCLLA